MNRLARLFGLAVAFVASLAPAAQRVDAAGPAINGGGSSFASLEIDQWRAEVARSPYDLTVNYVAQGSTFGRTQFMNNNFDFAASDIPFLGAEIAGVNASRPDYAYVPVSAGGLGFMYNVIDRNGRRVEDLHLTRRAVCRMFSEPDIRWTDPEIQDANPDIPLPDEFVRPIVRADGSGTSYVFSEFCIAAAKPVWDAFVASQPPGKNSPDFDAGRPTSNWPVDWGRVSSQVAADGVASVVADPNNGKNAITYNEAGFALVRGFPNAYVQNAAGAWLLPNEDNVSVALAYATPTTDDNGRPGTFLLEYSAPDAAAYFPSTYSYAIVQTTGFDPAKGEVLARFLCYAVTRGQREELTKGLGYARLSQPLVEIARTSIAQIPGAPPWEQCRVDSEAPPPPPTTVPPGGDGGGGGGGGGGSGGGGGGGESGGGGADTGGGGGSGDDGSGGGGDSTGSGSGSGSSGSGSGSGSATTLAGSASTTTVPCSTTTTTTTIVAAGDSSTTTSSTTTTIATAATAVGEATTTTTTTLVPCVDVATQSGDDSSVVGALCTDPITGEDVFDAVVCASFGVVVLEEGGADQGAAAQVAGAGPPAINPTVDDSDEGPTSNQITWVLLQGASVCAGGAALAATRRKVSL